jgi:hypothetical protein
LRDRIQNAPKRDGEKERRRSREWEKASREREREGEIGRKECASTSLALLHHRGTCATPQPLLLFSKPTTGQ